ncbi:Plasmid stabilization system protein [compost metagenome]
MIRKIRFRQEAESELKDALDWYEACAAGLGTEFLKALDSCLARISHQPKSYPLVHGQARRALFRHFPYGLIYREDADGILIIACHHQRQRPERWRKRLS